MGPWFARSGTIMHDLGSQRANMRVFGRRSNDGQARGSLMPHRILLSAYQYRCMNIVLHTETFRSMILARVHVAAWFVILKKRNLRNVNCMAVLNQVPPPQNSARVSEAENHAYSQRHVAFFNVGTQTSIHVLIVPDA